MADNSVIVRIDGDDSGLQEKLSGIKSKTKAGLADIKAGIDMTTQALEKLASVAMKGISYNAQIEQMQTSFEVMTGSAEKAAEVVERLRVMGAETPFETTDLVSVTQLLMQYGFTADDAIEKMSMLGDIAQGNKEAMVSIATGYAQMSSAGKVNLQDVKQMINGGFNPLQEISERTGESMASLYDRISKGTMAISEITDSMKYATSEGGKFYQSMEKQSKTLSGQLSTLKDNATELLGSLTSGMSEGLADEMLPLASNMIAELQSAFDKNGYKGLIDSVTDMIPDLLDMMSGKLETMIPAIAKWAPKLANSLMNALPGAVRAASSALPQLTSAVYSVASTVLRDVIGMLPELIPELAEGMINMFTTSLTGIFDIAEGVIEGVEQIFHQGQKKIAGVWVDEETIAKFKVGLEAEINVEDAETEIETAYTSIRTALNQTPLSDEQKTELLQMLGDDADAIKAKLMEFGLSDEQATELAETISNANDKIVEAYDALNIGIDGRTLAKLANQAKGSRLMLKFLLKQAGLSNEAIDEVVAVYDEMTGKIGEKTPSIMEEIYDKLTDGEPDDDQTVATLNGKIQSYINGLLTKLDEIYAAEMAALDTTAADYQEKKAALDEWYTSTKSSITGMNTDMVSLVDTLAGAPTSVVEARMAEFAEMEAYLALIEESLDAMEVKAKSAAENAFQVVRSGANADEETIGMAFNLKVTEFKLDEQAAEDAYTAAKEQLDAELASGTIDKETYNTKIEGLKAEEQAAVEAARARLEHAIGQMFAGIADSEGAKEALIEAGEKYQLGYLIYGALENSSLDVPLSESIGDELMQKIAESMQMDPEELKAKVDSGWEPMLLSNYAAELIGEGEKALEGADTSKLAEAYAMMLEAGMLDGTKLAEANPEGMTEIVAQLAISAFENSQPQVKEAGAALGEAATSEMADEKGAQTAGDNTVNGLISALNKAAIRARAAGIKAGKAFSEGYRVEMEIQSPSKVMKRLGEYTGEGLEVGLNESMARAVRVANQMLGGLTTSADLTRVTNVSMPELRQEISIAADQNKTPVNIDGHKVAEIQGQNNAAQLRWLRARDARGYGQR